VGIRSGLSELRASRRRTAHMAASVQLASSAWQPKVQNANESPQPNRGQPVEAPQLGEPRVSILSAVDNVTTNIPTTIEAAARRKATIITAWGPVPIKP
jgi:hypothetical protein